MRIEIPKAVEEIIEKLNRHGFEAFAVGGCVRDSLLGKEPEDWDITTAARPEQVKEIFRRTIDTGIQHGTVTVMKDHTGYEVTTYRIDGKYEDGRHPKEVRFTASLREDLCRRDFTINAMAYSHERGIVDEFGGMDDLQAGVIRCVGKPLDRFTEDALRILRAIRFSAQLGFEIEPETKAAIKTIAPNIAKVSKERVQTELTKLLLSDRPDRIKEVYKTGISPYVSEPFHRAGSCPVSISSELPARKHIRWAAFLREMTEEEAVQILKDMKMDNDTIYRVRVLNRWWDQGIVPEKPAVRRVMSQMEPPLFDELLVLKQHTGQPEAAALADLAAQIRIDKDCISLKELAVRGDDLLAASVKPGKQVGQVLAGLLDLVLEDPSQNRKDILLRHVRAMIK